MKENKEEIKTIAVSLNPLVFTNLDSAWTEIGRNDPTPKGLMKNLCYPNIDPDFEILRTRYEDITKSEERLLRFTPAHDQQLLDKVIWPLRSAKASYILGNCIGTIALCGMVAEMIAILTFEIADIKINEEQIKDKDQERLFGKTFEKLGQYKKILVLEAFKVIGKKLKNKFESIRLIRNKYLHYWSGEHENLEADARETYASAVYLVAKTIGQEIKESRLLILNPAFEKYMIKRGLIQTHKRETEP